MFLYTFNIDFHFVIDYFLKFNNSFLKTNKFELSLKAINNGNILLGQY